MLVGVLALQVVLELLIYGDAAIVPWFQVVYVAHALAVLASIVLVVPRLVVSTRTWWRR